MQSSRLSVRPQSLHVGRSPCTAPATPQPRLVTAPGESQCWESSRPKATPQKGDDLTKLSRQLHELLIHLGYPGATTHERWASPVSKEVETVFSFLLAPLVDKKSGTKWEDEVRHVFAVLKYPQPMHKSVLQPYGSRNSWTTCASALVWLGNLHASATKLMPPIFGVPSSSRDFLGRYASYGRRKLRNAPPRLGDGVLRTPGVLSRSVPHAERAPTPEQSDEDFTICGLRGMSMEESDRILSAGIQSLANEDAVDTAGWNSNFAELMSERLGCVVNTLLGVTFRLSKMAKPEECGAVREKWQNLLADSMNKQFSQFAGEVTSGIQEETARKGAAEVEARHYQGLLDELATLTEKAELMKTDVAAYEQRLVPEALEGLMREKARCEQARAESSRWRERLAELRSQRERVKKIIESQPVSREVVQRYKDEVKRMNLAAGEFEDTAKKAQEENWAKVQNQRTSLDQIQMQLSKDMHLLLSPEVKSFGKSDPAMELAIQELEIAGETLVRKARVADTQRERRREGGVQELVNVFQWESLNRVCEPEDENSAAFGSRCETFAGKVQRISQVGSSLVAELEMSNASLKTVVREKEKSLKAAENNVQHSKMELTGIRKTLAEERRCRENAIISFQNQEKALLEKIEAREKETAEIVAETKTIKLNASRRIAEAKTELDRAVTLKMQELEKFSAKLAAERDFYLNSLLPQMDSLATSSIMEVLRTSSVFHEFERECSLDDEKETHRESLRASRGLSDIMMKTFEDIRVVQSEGHCGPNANLVHPGNIAWKESKIIVKEPRPDSDEEDFFE